jgi:hypothetical protein
VPSSLPESSTVGLMSAGVVGPPASRRKSTDSMPSRHRQRWFGVGPQLKLAIAKQLAGHGIDALLKPPNGYGIQLGLSGQVSKDHSAGRSEVIAEGCHLQTDSPKSPHKLDCKAKITVSKMNQTITQDCSDNRVRVLSSQKR